MTKKEAVVIEAYTGVCMLKGEDRNLFYKYINQLMGRKVYMYEILALEREIKEKAEPDFIKICKNVGKEIKTRKFRAITICEQEQVIEKMQVEIDRLKCLTEEKDREIEHLAKENEKLEDALADNGANLLIKQIIDDIVESGLVKFEVKE